MKYYNGVYEIDLNDPPFILIFMVKNHWIINKLKDTLSDTSSFKKEEYWMSQEIYCKIKTREWKS